MNRIRCPIHNHIPLEPSVEKIIDTPQFQRLRRIKQLGMAFLVYPGAQHTRFEHSLGVYHLGRVVSDMLGFGKEETNSISISGLLHDIGHGPFSHLMDRIGTDSHERRSASIIKSGEIADILSEQGIDPASIADTIQGNSRFSPFIASEIDLDRMDYLVRDSHYTGVSSGIDAGRLTAVMAIDEDRLVFREAGLGAVESLLLGRFMMFPYVYYHHTARSAELMLIRALNHLCEQQDEVADQLWIMDDMELVTHIRSSSGFPGGIMGMIDNRRLYKRGWELSLTQLLQVTGNETTPMTLLKSLRQNLTPTRILDIEREIAEIVDLDPSEVLFDPPLPPEVNTREILIRLRDGTVTSARWVSQLITILEKAQLDHWKFRVFIPPEKRESAVLRLESIMPSLIVE